MKITRQVVTAFLAGAVLLVLLGHIPSANASLAIPPTWTLEFPAEGPSPRSDHTAVSDPTNNIMTIFAGRTFTALECVTCTASPLNDVWTLSNANGQEVGDPAWTLLTPTGYPPDVRFGHTAVYDSANNIMTIFGGETFATDETGQCVTCTATPLNDVWTLSNANGQGVTAGPAWTQLSTVAADEQNGQPAARTEHTAVYDQTNNIMIIFGGKTFDANNCVTCTATPLNDVWVLSHANGIDETCPALDDCAAEAPTWTKLSPTGHPPKRRFGHTAVHDAENNIMTIYGGETFKHRETEKCGKCTARPLGDVWVLSHANGSDGTPAWTKLSPGPDPSGDSPDPRSEHTAVYDATNNIMTIFAGKTFSVGQCVTCTATPLGDLWALSNANGQDTTGPAWTRITAAGDPTFGRPEERFGHTAVYDQTNNIMTIFAGETFESEACGVCSSEPLADVWVLTGANGIVVSGSFDPHDGIRLASLASIDAFEVNAILTPTNRIGSFAHRRRGRFTWEGVSTARACRR